MSLTYPTVDDIADRIIQLGPGCLLFKRDLKRAYRQLPVDPFDYPLLGYSWRDKLFFDVRLPMGLRSAAYGLSASHERGMFYALVGRLQRFELFRRFHGDLCAA